MARCRRSDDRFRRVRQISTNLYICSKHFDEKPDKMDYSKCLPNGNSNLIVRPNNRRRLQVEELALAEESENRQVLGESIEHQQELSSSNMEEEPIVTADGTVSPSTSRFGSTDICQEATRSVGTQTTTSLPTIEQMTTIIERLNLQIVDLKRKLCDAEKAKTQAQKAQTVHQLPLVVFEQQLATNEDMCKFYTGFDINQLKAVTLFSAVDKIHYWGSTFMNESENTESSSKPQGRSRNYTQAQELLLFFLRLRGGFLLEDIAYRFNLSSSFVSRMVVTWTQILFQKFDSVRSHMFVPRHIINAHLPARFKKFKNIRVIIDCAEIRCEKSSSFEQQGNCYSEYKAHTTFKLLIGCTPNGGVSFLR
ncbi:hypothetical protein GE061_015373 [Apolygus lucorum]|uniref:THAP-type domain-containing protein n=1 Tax=Apolygus lucorum TaxID=248454 RepID=A0A8S9XPU9_APOLU|nr:hypothetical protein GE061_015373 [Apolygus lucorum]